MYGTVSHVSKDLILSYINIYTIDFNSLQKVLTDFRTKSKTSRINNGLFQICSPPPHRGQKRKRYRERGIPRGLDGEG